LRARVPGATLSALPLSLVLLAACGGGEGIVLPGDGEPAAIAVVDGNEQLGRVGEPLNEPLVVQVTDSRGRPVEGATVAFEFSSAAAGAGVVPEEKTTNGDGLADARLVLGTSIGRQTGQARVVLQEGRAPLEASFSAMALPENANSMAAVAGQDQTGNVGLPLADRLVVEVTDGFGNPVAGVPISWEAVGGGSVSESVVNTEADGRARVERILGPGVGQQTTVASSEGLAGSPVTFVHTALAGDASRLVIVSGNDQTAEAGSTLPAELVVQLIDAEGNGVPQTAVSWVVATGGGVATPENTTTDGDGRTSTRWTLGGTLGEQRLDAVVSGVGVASFRAVAVASAPPSLLIRTQPSASARSGVPFTRQPVVQLRDSQGNDVAQAGVLVTVAIGSGGGELSGTRQVATDASGLASFTNLSISGPPGRRTLIFTAPGYAQATSSEVEILASATSTTITSDSPDPSAEGAAFAVSFRVASDGGTPTGSVTVSDGVQSCTGSLAGGAGSCQLALTTAGARTLTATYSGAPGFLGSTDTEPHAVTAAAPPPPAATSTTITADSPDPSVSGSTFTVSFQVTSTGGTPTGSVAVSVSGGTPTCTGQLNAGSGSCQLTLNIVGERTLTATYSGSPEFSGSSDTENHTVAPVPPQNRAPDADFDSDCSDLTCQFTDTSRDRDGTITGWSWDFGDGSSSTETNPTHTYQTPGRYRVTLTVTDNGGLTDDASETVDPKAPPPPNQAPTAGFTWECDELDCEFDDASSDSDGRIDEYAWTFGDGGTSSDDDPDHEYSASGTYQVTLTVTDNDGASSSVTQPVSVTAAPPPPANTSTTITADTPDPSDPGQAFSVSFTVTAASGTPTGTVTVTDGVESCTDDLAGGSGSCSLALSTSGERTLTATYAGDVSFEGSTDTEPHTVNAPAPAGTTTTITDHGPNPSNAGELVAVSFTVTSSAGAPGGTVTVTDGVDGCTGQLQGGSGSCALTLTTSGSRTLTATYEGGPGFSSSAGSVQHTVS
jgi:PKD repeat protein